MGTLRKRRYKGLMFNFSEIFGQLLLAFTEKSLYLVQLMKYNHAFVIPAPIFLTVITVLLSRNHI